LTTTHRDDPCLPNRCPHSSPIPTAEDGEHLCVYPEMVPDAVAAICLLVSAPDPSPSSDGAPSLVAPESMTFSVYAYDLARAEGKGGPLQKVVRSADLLSHARRGMMEAGGGKLPRSMCVATLVRIANGWTLRFDLDVQKGDGTCLQGWGEAAPAAVERLCAFPGWAGDAVAAAAATHETFVPLPKVESVPLDLAAATQHGRAALDVALPPVPKIRRPPGEEEEEEEEVNEEDEGDAPEEDVEDADEDEEDAEKPRPWPHAVKRVRVDFGWAARPHHPKVRRAQLKRIRKLCKLLDEPEPTGAPGTPDAAPTTKEDADEAITALLIKKRAKDHAAAIEAARVAAEEKKLRLEARAAAKAAKAEAKAAKAEAKAAKEKAAEERRAARALRAEAGEEVSESEEEEDADAGEEGEDGEEEEEEEEEEAGSEEAGSGDGEEDEARRRRERTARASLRKRRKRRRRRRRRRRTPSSRLSSPSSTAVAPSWPPWAPKPRKKACGRLTLTPWARTKSSVTGRAERTVTQRASLSRRPFWSSWISLRPVCAPSSWGSRTPRAPGSRTGRVSRRWGRCTCVSST